jgi:hypothetical protein
MDENSNVVRLCHPDEIDDPLTNILRSGARQLLAQAIELEAEAFLAEMKDLRLADGRGRVVRHGQPQRKIALPHPNRSIAAPGNKASISDRAVAGRKVSAIKRQPFRQPGRHSCVVTLIQGRHFFEYAFGVRPARARG